MTAGLQCQDPQLLEKPTSTREPSTPGHRPRSAHLDYVEAVRLLELHTAVQGLAAGLQILEIGAGNGWQARELSRLGHRVEAVDLPNSAPAAQRVWPVREYDGKTLPFPSASFDLVFSSNVLEHVEDLDRLLAEAGRVLHPDGMMIHIVPSASWRLWTIVTYYPDLLLRALSLVRADCRSAEAEHVHEGYAEHSVRRPLRKVLTPAAHGSHGGVLGELVLFRRVRWEARLAGAGVKVVEYRRSGLFYSGTMFLAALLSFRLRQKLSFVLGSSCHIFFGRV